jgi:hypothetical protein
MLIALLIAVALFCLGSIFEAALNYVANTKDKAAGIEAGIKASKG